VNGRASWSLAGSLLIGLARAVAAQTADTLYTKGVESYRALDYPAAAELLRRSLVAEGPARLADSLRPTAYVYLGAAELFRGNRDAANAAFRSAVAADPRHRADPMIFPPEVTEAYRAARQRVVAVRIDPPPDTAIAPGKDRYRTRIYAAGLTTVRVELESAEGRFIRALYSGPIGDSLDVAWDGLDAGGRPLEGTINLRVTPIRKGASPPPTRQGLVTRLVVPDTLQPPTPLKPEQLVTERRGSGPALRALGIGLAAGLVAVFLPKIVAHDDQGSSARYVVGGAIGAATAVGVIGLRPGSVIPDSARANQALRDRWKAQVDSVRAANQRRRADARLMIHAVAPAAVAERTPS
jgi:hypothetical protein